MPLRVTSTGAARHEGLVRSRPRGSKHCAGATNVTSCTRFLTSPIWDKMCARTKSAIGRDQRGVSAL
jgi:hypothetical protein